MGRLSGKTAVVTGAGRGIGFATARLFAQEGAKVALIEWVGDRCRSAAAAIGDDAFPIVADVSDRAAMEAAMSQILELFGKVDIWMNNAGVDRMAPFVDATDEEFDLIVGVDLKGTFIGSQLAARHMLASGAGGSIINVASFVAEAPYPNNAIYNAAKRGVQMLTRSAARELGPTIRVNSISPGCVETEFFNETLDDPVAKQALIEMIPLRRMAEPEDIALGALFLASDDARYVTGIDLVVDGGILLAG